jgi:predicted DNA-binding antitoxin AbrB/MazE fold protein
VAKNIKALYQNGVFKPLTKVRLKERQKVELTVVESETVTKPTAKSVSRHRASSRTKVTLDPAYRIVGLFKSGVRDLSKSHDKYLYP